MRIVRTLFFQNVCSGSSLGYISHDWFYVINFISKSVQIFLCIQVVLQCSGVLSIS